MAFRPLSEILGESKHTVSLVRAMGPAEQRSLGRALSSVAVARRTSRPDGSHLFGRHGLHPMAGWDTSPLGEG